MLLFRKRKGNETRVRSTSSVAARVPIDIWDLIIDFVMADTNSFPSDRYPPLKIKKLYGILFVNSVFHHSAERALYRRIDLKGYPVHLCVRRTRLFETLASVPRLARLVGSLFHPTITHRNVSGMGRALGQMYITAFRRALHSLSRLHSLHFYPHGLSDATDELDFYQLLDGCPFRLRNLALPFWSPESAPAIMEQQAELKELSIHLPFDGEMFSSEIFPKLRTLSVTWSRAMSEPSTFGLLSANKQILALHFCDRIRIGPIQGGPYQNIRSLRIPRSYQSSDLHAALVYFPALRYLRLDCSESLSDLNIMEAYAGLQNAPFLRKIVFMCDIWETPGNWQAITSALLSKFPSLECICFGEESWERGKEGPIRTPDNQHEWKDPKWWT